MTEKTVKTYYKELTYLISVNFLIGLVILFYNPTQNINYPTSYLIPIILETILFSNIPLVIKDIIPESMIMKLVFIDHYKQPLPSGRIFDEIENDSLIDYENLISKYFSTKNLPKNYDESLRIWYKIYREHSEDPRAEQAQKDFLFYRDSFGAILIIIIMTSIIILINYLLKINNMFEINYLILYFIILIIELVLYGYLTRLKSKSFVKGILITASHIEKEKTNKTVEIYHKVIKNDNEIK